MAYTCLAELKCHVGSMSNYDESRMISRISSAHSICGTYAIIRDIKFDYKSNSMSGQRETMVNECDLK